jgi:guanylate kinase
MSKGKLIIITGPSAVGKTTITNALLKQNKDLVRVVTYTTRAKRDREIDGVDYNFISRDDFEKKLQENFFIEWATVYKQYYGNSNFDIQEILKNGKTAIILLDPQGTKTIKEKMPETTAIFIMPESLNQLSERLWRRPNAEKEKIQTRLNMTKHEIDTYKPICDFSIINEENQLKNSIKQVNDIIYDKS